MQDVYRDAVARDKLARLLKLIEQRDGHWLALQVEEGKIALSDQDVAQLHLERLAPDLVLQLQRATFDAAIAHLVAGVERTVSQLLCDAGVAAGAVDTVFFTGGSSSVPLLRKKIAALLPTARRVEGDLFGSIGTGLALDAARKFG